jgi:hypothetical protein
MTCSTLAAYIAPMSNRPELCSPLCWTAMRGTLGVSDAPRRPAISLSESCVVMSPLPFRWTMLTRLEARVRRTGKPTLAIPLMLVFSR